MRVLLLSCSMLLATFALPACGTKKVTYDVTIENPYADVQGVTATLKVEGGPKDVPLSGKSPTVQVELPAISKRDAMRQLLLVTIHAPLPCGKTDLELDTQWAEVDADLALMEKNQHPTVSVKVPAATTPKRCDKK